MAQEKINKGKKKNTDTKDKKETTNKGKAGESEFTEGGEISKNVEHLKNLEEQINEEYVEIIEDEKALEAINEIRKSMEKDQYYLLCQYAISIMEAKAKIIDEQLAMKYGREIMRDFSGRVKSPESIYAKLVRKGLQTDLETARKKLNDLVGVRIICLFLDDVYEIADILKKQRDITLVKEKDYIAKPKKNGYMSLHLIVDIPIYFGDNFQSKRVEIQIRTLAMDFWSVLEYQLMYKKNVSGAEKIGKELKNYSEAVADLDEKMMKLRNKIDKI